MNAGNYSKKNWKRRSGSAVRDRAMRRLLAESGPQIPEPPETQPATA